MNPTVCAGFMQQSRPFLPKVQKPKMFATLDVSNSCDVAPSEVNTYDPNMINPVRNCILPVVEIACSSRVKRDVRGSPRPPTKRVCTATKRRNCNTPFAEYPTTPQQMKPSRRHHFCIVFRKSSSVSPTTNIKPRRKYFAIAVVLLDPPASK